MNEKPEALRLAEWIESDPIPGDDKIASTLRRLHAENERLREVVDALDAGDPSWKLMRAALRREET